jgi:hypothetical protein
MSQLGGLRTALSPARMAAGFPRHLALGRLYELFFVSAISSLLLIRGALALSGFPQVGGGGLHVAHMLWGGLLMLVSLLLLLGFIGRRTLYVAALLSGIGFGTFVDELGKFITSDNDYFFRPAIAVVYVLFVLLFLALRTLETRGRFSDRELVANAFDAAREATVTRRRPSYSAPVMAYLRERSGEDPLMGALERTLERAPIVRRPPPGPLRRVRWTLLRLYVSLVDSQGLDLVIGAAFVLYTAMIALTIGLAVADYRLQPPPSPLSKDGIAFTGLIASNVLSAAMVAIAAWRLRRSRLAALRWFDRAVTLDLLIGQVFVFYLLQFGALLGVSLDIALLLVVKGAARTLRRLEQRRPAA